MAKKIQKNQKLKLYQENSNPLPTQQPPLVEESPCFQAEELGMDLCWSSSLPTECQMEPLVICTPQMSGTCFESLCQAEAPETLVTQQVTYCRVSKRQKKRLLELSKRGDTQKRFTVVVIPDSGSPRSQSCSSLQAAADVVREATSEAVNNFSLRQYSIYVIDGSIVPLRVAAETGAVCMRYDNVVVRGRIRSTKFTDLVDGRLDGGEEQPQTTTNESTTDMFGMF